MKDRIKELRKSLKLNQTDFGRSLGVSLSAVQKWESGENDLSDAVILLISQQYGVSETWLRTGEGEMRAAKSREQEMAEMVKRLMADRPDSFRSALITTLLRLDPNGKEWAVLEDIYKRIAEAQKDQEP